VDGSDEGGPGAGEVRPVEILDAGYFGVGDELIQLIIERAGEAAGTPVAVNCDTCAYRRPWPGLEDRVGSARGVGHSHLAADHLSHEGHA
jgi:sirohydrochlorin cobaltochelatase